MWGRFAVASFLVCLGLVSGGCHRRSATHVDARRHQNLERRAARDLSCPGVALTIEQLDERLWRASGCGGWVDYAIIANGRHRRYGARWRVVMPLAQRAMAELGCSPEQIHFEGRSPRRYAVAGCGRALEMELRCGDVDCGWVAATPMQSVAVPTTPPVTTAPAVVVQPTVEATPTQPPPAYGASVTVTVH
jgi:hypothetical protein